MKHTYEFRDETHFWVLVGPEGAVHIWARKALDGRTFTGNRYYGGIEVHGRKPLYEDQAISHENCWLLNGPCYHDGSSLYFSERLEHWLPNEGAPSEECHRRMKEELEDWYASKFGGEK